MRTFMASCGVDDKPAANGFTSPRAMQLVGCNDQIDSRAAVRGRPWIGCGGRRDPGLPCKRHGLTAAICPGSHAVPSGRAGRTAGLCAAVGAQPIQVEHRCAAELDTQQTRPFKLMQRLVGALS